MDESGPTVVWSTSGSPYHWLKRSKVISRGSQLLLARRGYCARKSQPPRSVRSAVLYSPEMVRKPLPPSEKPFQPDTVSVSPSLRLRLSSAGADQVGVGRVDDSGGCGTAPPGGVPVSVL